MKSSEQDRAEVNKKSGQEVAKQNFGKTDARYWHDVVFKPIYMRAGKTRCVEDWAARIQWRGRRELFNLKTPNKTAAAAKAKDIYTTLVGAGWDVALQQFKPEMQVKAVLTVVDSPTEYR